MMQVAVETVVDDFLDRARYERPTTILAGRAVAREVSRHCCIEGVHRSTARLCR